MARNEFSWMQQHVSNDEWCSTRRSNNMGTSVVTYVNTYIKHIAAYNRISTRKSQLKLLKICQPQISTKTCSHVEVIMHRCAVKIVTGELGPSEHALDLSIPNSSHCQPLPDTCATHSPFGLRLNGEQRSTYLANVDAEPTPSLYKKQIA